MFAGSEQEQSYKTVLSHNHSGCSLSLLGCSVLLEDGSFHKHLMKEKAYFIRGMGGNVYKAKLTRGLVRLLKILNYSLQLFKSSFDLMAEKPSFSAFSKTMSFSYQIPR